MNSNQQMDLFDSIPDDQIFLPGNVPSSKNSKKVIAVRKKSGEIVGCNLVPSDLSDAYKKWIDSYMDEYHFTFLDMIKDLSEPYLIGFHFTRDSNKRFDFHNAVQIIADLMSSKGWLEDDNCSVMFPVPLFKDGKAFTVRKDCPGVYIKVFTNKEEIINQLS